MTVKQARAAKVDRLLLRGIIFLRVFRRSLSCCAACRLVSIGLFIFRERSIGRLSGCSASRPRLPSWVCNDENTAKPEAVPLGGGVYKLEHDRELLRESKERVAESLPDAEKRCRKAGIRYRLSQADGSPHEQIIRCAESHDDRRSIPGFHDGARFARSRDIARSQ